MPTKHTTVGTNCWKMYCFTSADSWFCIARSQCQQTHNNWYCIWAADSWYFSVHYHQYQQTHNNANCCAFVGFGNNILTSTVSATYQAAVKLILSRLVCVWGARCCRRSKQNRSTAWRTWKAARSARLTCGASRMMRRAAGVFGRRRSRWGKEERKKVIETRP